jgi:HD-like signal output (HDOD) protein
MRSLLFWRKKSPAAEAAGCAVPAVAAPAPGAHPASAAAVSATALPLQRLVYALALDDPRAGDPFVRLDPAQSALLLAASREFARIGSEPRYTPHRPSLLPQLLEVINDEDASLRALSRIVAQDPQLTGELLRTANSALYRVSGTPIESIERASAMLGTRGIRTLIAAALVQPLARSAAGNTGRFSDTIWEHSLYSASAAEAWAARQQDADPFAAHLLALLHGLGCGTVQRVLLDLYAAQQALAPDAAVIATALETNAAVTASRIAASWGLSSRTFQALESQSSAAPVNDATGLTRALQFGLLCGAVTLLCRSGRLAASEGEAQLASAGFSDAQVARIWDRMLRAYVHP